MIDIKAIWEIYKKSDVAKDALKRFETLNIEALIHHYNPGYASSAKEGTIADFIDSLYCYGFSEMPIPTTAEEAKLCLSDIGYFGVMEEGEWVIPPRDFEILSAAIVPLSFAASAFAPQYFYPYLFMRSFAELGERMKLIGIELPPTPQRKAMEDRFMYYWSLCEIFNHIRKTYCLSHEELCVFIYDFLPYCQSRQSEELSPPTQCWFIGGLMHESTGHEKESWQVNIDTRPGDILVHYETSPISALTAVWRAEGDGYIDPFFHWHTCATIGRRIDIPHISLTELKEDPFFKDFPLVKKNFQGVNGFRMGADAYNRLLWMLSQKGMDISVLPKLYAPSILKDVSLHNEHDVEEKLLIPLLESFNLKYDTDYKRQMGIHVGRGHRVFPDFVIGYNEREESAHIIIEAKFDMSTRKDIEMAFKQARSYALNLKTSILILCDKNRILIFKRHGDDFNKTKYETYAWSQMESSDCYAKFKKSAVTINTEPYGINLSIPIKNKNINLPK